MRLLSIIFSLLLSTLHAQDLASFKASIDTLTTPTMAGRGYVNREDTLAANYIAHRFAQLGLQKVEGTYLQEFPITVNIFSGNVVLSLDGKKAIPGVDFICSPYSGSGKGTFKTFYPTSTKGQELLAKGKFHDKVAVIEEKDYKKLSKEVLSTLMTSKGIVVLKESKLTASYASYQVPIPVIELKKQSDELIKKISFDISSEVWSGNTQNVMGLIKGKNTDSTIIISGHYDHLGKMGDIYFAGANDNASGIAMLLELAQYFSDNDTLLKYNLMFVAFSGEEAGLVGSKYFVENPIIPLSSIKAQITLDLFGAGTKGMTVVNAPDNPHLFNLLMEANNDYLYEIKSRKQAANSDHYFFAQEQVPSIFLYTLGDLTAYHDINDTAEKMEYEAFENVFNCLKAFIIALEN